MTGTIAIHALPAGSPTLPAASALDPGSMRIEFDALMLEMMIKSSGMLDALDSSGEGGSMLMGEMLAYPLARQIAEQMDLGFGAMAVRMAEAKFSEEVQK